MCFMLTYNTYVTIRDRSFVIFWDPRDVVLSAYKMRTQVFLRSWVARSSISEEEHIRQGFEVSKEQSFTDTRLSGAGAFEHDCTRFVDRALTCSGDGKQDSLYVFNGLKTRDTPAFLVVS